MGMKLLKKSEVLEHKSFERKLEIDQGALLAKRVDSLREIHAEEEASLASFRSKTLNAIHNEILELSKAKLALEGQVQILQSVIDAGTTHVDTLRAELKLSIMEYDAKLQALHLRIDTVALKEGELDALLKEARDNVARAETEKKRADEMLQKADTVLQEAYDYSAIISKKSAQFDENVHAITNLLEERDAAVRVAEHANSTEKRRLDELAVVLGDKERAINDKYAALLQAQKHLHDQSNLSA